MPQLSQLPKVDKVLQWPTVRELLAEHPRTVVLEAVRDVLADIRGKVVGGKLPVLPTQEETARLIRLSLVKNLTPSLHRVVNGTGVVIHTNLGRSPLADAARDAIAEICSCYSNLEYDVDTGSRGSRYVHVENLLCQLTGAEAALVVNNNAAAVLLALAATAAGGEVIVSRGELVEIGGSFRIPDILRQSGAVLREVGTTNRTHLRDYRNAITPETSLLLKVHRSNFAVLGFTSEVSPAELADLGREMGVPVMADAGSGNLLPLESEPTIREYLRGGVDLVTFSGDKMLGGPQAGLIVGTERLVGPLKQHPLLRALRIDKLSLAALEATLRLYADERLAFATVPVLQMLTATREQLRRRGQAILRRLRRILPPTVTVALADGCSQVGGGALPLAQLSTTLLAVRRDGLSPQEIEYRLKHAPVPVVGRIYKGQYLLDLRTILPGDEKSLANALHLLAE